MTTSTARPADPPDYPRDGTFAVLLKWHIAWGTRPDCSTTTRNNRWKADDITAAIYGLSSSDPKDREALDSAKKTVGNWKRGGLPHADSPERIDRLFTALFGEVEGLRPWKGDLENALKNDRVAKAEAQSQAQPKPHPANPPTNEPARVPFPTAHFSGRDNEVEAISAGLVSGGQRAILIQGGPGIGKTELAKAVTHHGSVVSYFGDRCWFVSLAEATTAATMRDAIVRVVGGTPAKGLKLALDALGPRPSLLVLDDLETPWEIVGERQGVETILAELARSHGLAILGTFRGRHQFKESGWDPHPVEPLDHTAASELLQRIAGPWVLKDERLEDFIEALGGVPLAINLLAHRAAGRTSLAPLWREWQERGVDILNLPDEPAGPLSSFSQSILLSLNSNRTTPDARRLFAMLGQLSASILDEHLSAIFGDAALDAVNSLLRVGLAVETSGRIALLPSVKAFASRKCLLVEEDETGLREHYLSVIAKLGREVATADDANHVTRIEAELPNIEWALSNALEDGKIAGVADALRGFSRFVPLSTISINIFTDVNKFYNVGNDRFLWAYTNVLVGDVTLRRGDLDSAERAYRRATMYLRDAEKDRAEALIKYAEIHRRRRRYDDAKKYLNEAFTIFENNKEWDDRPSEGRGFIVQAHIDFAVGEYERADHYFMFSSEYCENADIATKGMGIKGLGEVMAINGRMEFARGLIGEAQAYFRRINFRLWEAHCIASLGRLDLREALHDAAQSKFDEALAVFQEIGFGPGEADAKQGLEEVARARAAPAEPASTAE